MGNWLSHDWLSQRKRKRAEEESTEGASASSPKRAKEESTEGASTSSSTSLEATGVGSGQYDIFLSFRGSDTRKEFTDHLYHSLEKAGIVPFGVFKDDKSIPIGEEFPSHIFDAITRSKISIPILSKNYASSKWCLRELIHIMNCKKSSSHIVLPIFYKVTPSNVRHLDVNSGRAFRFRSSQKRFDEKDIREGRQALREVSYLHGWESSKVANGHEGELIQLVVKTVQSKLQKDFQLDIPRQLVGLDGRLMKIMNWIRTPSVNARMIGIYGIGGMGKTTLAKCIYNQLLDEFQHASFLPNIREKATHHDGMKDLQSQLIYDILQSENKVSRIDDGINIIKSRFKGKKVLILLDDIDDKNQLDVLARERDWFMAGSMIIVTTRNEATLDQSEFEVDYKYELEGLDEVQSLFLFESHAFRGDPSREDFRSISHDIVSTLGGLPLALKVVGAYLYKTEDRKVWEDVGRQLKIQPFEEVQKTLRISYDALTSEHKQIFVDIACFFIGQLSKFAMCVWEGYGFFPSIGIEELKLRCLIDINNYGLFEMHDQLRDLGRSIFCEGQPLENRSRPWDVDYEGVPRVLRQYECARFDNLMRAASREGENLSEVRWLQWRIDENDSSLSTVNLRLPKLSVLELEKSHITEDWEIWSSFRESTRLKALNLEDCLNLRTTPDLSVFTQLKILILKGCRKLKHLHPSIGTLTSLVSLNLWYCGSLKELPKEVGQLKDLEELELVSSGIAQIPTSIGSLEKLKKLNASYCESLREIPSSIGNLSSLKQLNLKSCKSLRGIPITIGDLQNLQHLDISHVAIEEFPSAIERLKNLQALDISWARISYVPDSIRNLSSLQRLDIRQCDKLRSLPELPSSLTSLLVSGQSLRLPQLSSLIHLEELHLLEDIPELPSRLLQLNGIRYLEVFSIFRCSSIERLDLSELIYLKRLRVSSCNNLVEIHGQDNLEFLEYISIWDCNSINNLLYLKSRCLKELSVSSCNNLVKIQGPLDGVKFLERLYITECKSLKALPDLTGCEKLISLIIQDCKKLTHIQGPEKLDLSLWGISGCDSLKTIPKLSGERV